MMPMIRRIVLAGLALATFAFLPLMAQQRDARHGGVVTGIEELDPGMTDKRLRFLKQAVPTIVRVAVLSPAPTQVSHALQYNEAAQTAKAIGVTLRAYRVSATSDFEKVFDDIAKDRADAILAFNGVLPRPIQERILQRQANQR